MRGVIAFRDFLRAHGTSARCAAALIFVVAVLVWAHSGGEAHAMGDENGGEHDAIAVCLAVLTGIAAIGITPVRPQAIADLRPIYAPPRILGATLKRRDTQLGRPPPRAGPTALQVFLR